MANFSLAARAVQQHPVFSRVDVASGCPICSTVHFLYDFTVGRHRLSQCAGCGLTRLDSKPNIGSATLSKSSNAITRAAADGLKSASFVQSVVTLAMDTYAGPKTGASHERSIVLLGEGKDITDLRGVTAQFVSLKCISDGDLSAERLDTVFDAVLLETSIESVAEPSVCLREARRLLRPGGLLLLRAEYLNIHNAIADRALLSDGSVSYLYSFDQIRSLLFAVGFGDIHLHPIEEGGIRPQTYSRTVKGHVAVIARLRMRTVEESGCQSLSIIMPVFNEKSTFLKTFELVYSKQLDNLVKEIIIVESNSTDGTREDVLAVQHLPGVCVLLQDRPQGKGFAVRAGLALATGDFILIQDADLEYDIEDYDLLLEPLLSHRAAFVLGVRHGELGPGWKMRRFNEAPLLSHILNFAHLFFTGMFNVIYGTRVRDPFTMFKLFRHDCIAGLTFEANRFDFDWEIMAKIVRRGYRPAEIPVNYISRSFAEGKKVSFFLDPLTWIRACIKFRLVRIP